MARVTKAYLVTGVFCLVLGLAVSMDLIDSKNHPMLTVVLPAGAICLGLFFICYIFENEAARFDEEQQALLKRVKSAQSAEASSEHIARRPTMPGAGTSSLGATASRPAR